MKDYKEQYLKEIKRPSLIEIVDECFDSISTMLTANAVLYGSTVTSAIAGLPIEGDLDIAVSHLEFVEMSKNLANSAKWLQVEGDQVPEDDFSRNRGWRTAGGKPSPYPPSPNVAIGYQAGRSNPSKAYGRVKASPSRNADYKDVPHLPISKLVAFKTVGGAKVQIVKSKESSGDPLEDALTVVRNVDFVFCGIAMDRYGRLLEVIEGAHDDCCHRIIRVAQYDPLIEPTKFMARFDKYTKRGWSLGISMDQAMENLEKARKDHQLAEAEKAKKLKEKQAKRAKIRRRSLSELYDVRPGELIFRRDFIKICPGAVIAENVTAVANGLGIPLEIRNNDPDYVLFRPVKKIAVELLGDIGYRACQRVNKKYNIDLVGKMSGHSTKRKEVRRRLRKKTKELGTSWLEASEFNSKVGGNYAPKYGSAPVIEEEDATPKRFSKYMPTYETVPEELPDPAVDVTEDDQAVPSNELLQGTLTHVEIDSFISGTPADSASIANEIVQEIFNPSEGSNETEETNEEE
jgi:hypothetical protein